MKTSGHVSAGPDLLMLHGFLGSPENWEDCASFLKTKFRLLAPELPFFDAPPGTDRIKHVQQFLEGLTDAHAARPLMALGNSFGGQLAVNLALARPDRFSGLVLTGSSGLFRRNLKKKVQLRPTREWARERIAEVFFDDTHVTEEMIKAVLALMQNRKKVRDSLQVARFIQQTSVRELLPQVRCPVLLIWGENDQITVPDTAREFKKLLRDAELHLLPDCGHVPMMEKPGEFARLVEDFIRRISPQPA